MGLVRPHSSNTSEKLVPVNKNVHMLTVGNFSSTKSSTKSVLHFNGSSSNVINRNVIDSFPCYYTNAQSILNKFSEFSDEISHFKPLIIGITETWLKPEIKDAEVQVRGYEFFDVIDKSLMVEEH